METRDVTDRARAWMREHAAVRYCQPLDGWWRCVVEAIHPLDPAFTLAGQATQADEVSARRIADAELYAAIERHFRDPAASAERLAADRAAVTFLPGSGACIRHVQRLLRDADEPEAKLIEVHQAYHRIANDGSTCGAVTAEVLAGRLRMSGGQGRLIA